MSGPLVVVCHPNLKESRVHRRWLDDLARLAIDVDVHDLHAAYPDWNIDVAHEQALIEHHDVIILQFPFYWFSCPPLLKKWLDEVFTRGWAYGAAGDRVAGKQLLLAISAGISREDYHAAGRYSWTIDELIRPFELTARYTGMRFSGTFSAHGVKPGADQWLVEKAAADYLAQMRLWTKL